MIRILRKKNFKTFVAKVQWFILDSLDRTYEIIQIIKSESRPA